MNKKIYKDPFAYSLLGLWLISLVGYDVTSDLKDYLGYLSVLLSFSLIIYIVLRLVYAAIGSHAKKRVLKPMHVVVFAVLIAFVILTSIALSAIQGL